jgi:hypothetical protein
MTSRPFARRAVSACAALLCLLTCASVASAAEKEDYTLAKIGTGCNSGQSDERGVLYISCGGQIRMYDSAGRLLGTTGKNLDASDVAPSPDGSYLYYGSSGTTLHRLHRTNGYAYAADNWAPQQFNWSGQMQTAYVSHVATDAFGYIYISDGGWTPNGLNTIIKFKPDGTFVTNFGEYTWGDGSKRAADGTYTDDRLWTMGQFYWQVEGVTSSRDGRRVYTTEVGNNRVTRWDWQNDGTYKAVSTFGNNKANDPKREGSCAPGMMAAPYDAATDPWGYVYITNATCTQVQKFTADGQFVFASYDGSSGTAGPGGNNQRSHQLAIDWNGNIWSGETGNKMVRPATSTPGPVPAVTEPVYVAPPAADTAAPILQAIKLPATTESSTVSVDITASDNVRVAQMRFASENGDDWTAWRDFATPAQVQLNAGQGYRGVNVQVRDAAGNESGVLYATTQVIAPAGAGNPPPPAPGAAPDGIAPTITNVVIPQTTTTRAINVHTDATDNVGVTWMRFASENGDDWTAWQAFAVDATYTIGASYSYHGVFVQVRDNAGNESTPVYRMTLLMAPPAGNQPQMVMMMRKAANKRLAKIAPFAHHGRQITARGSVKGTRGNDVISVLAPRVSPSRVLVNCGAGFDRAIVRVGTRTKGCEIVTRVRR